MKTENWKSHFLVTTYQIFRFDIPTFKAQSCLSVCALTSRDFVAQYEVGGRAVWEVAGSIPAGVKPFCFFVLKSSTLPKYSWRIFRCGARSRWDPSRQVEGSVPPSVNFFCFVYLAFLYCCKMYSLWDPFVMGPQSRGRGFDSFFGQNLLFFLLDAGRGKSGRDWTETGGRAEETGRGG